MKKDTGTGTGTGSGTGAGKKKRGRPKKRTYTVSEKALAQRREQAGIMPFEDEEGKSRNSMIIMHSLQTYELSQQADINDPESMLSCFRNYLVLCEKNGMKIGNIGACTAMGISVETLTKWRNGQRKADRPEYRKLAEMVSRVCSMSREQLINDGELHPVIGIFWQRNFDGLRNDTEQLQRPDENEIDEGLTSSEYRKKYGDLLDE